MLDLKDVLLVGHETNHNKKKEEKLTDMHKKVDCRKKRLFSIVLYR